MRASILGLMILLVVPLGCVKETDPEAECDDGKDNDLDGLYDCDDPDCAGVAGCPPAPGDDDDATSGDDDDVTPGDDDDATPGDDDDATADDDDSGAGDDDDSGVGDDDDSGAGDDDDSGAADDDDDTTIGGPPPSDFTLTDGNSTSGTYGQTLTLSAFLGQPVVIYFGFTTCGACQYCADALQALWDGHPGWHGNAQIWLLNAAGYDPDYVDMVDGFHQPILTDEAGQDVWLDWDALQGNVYVIHPDGTIYHFDDHLQCPGDANTIAGFLDILVSP